MYVEVKALTGMTAERIPAHVCIPNIILRATPVRVMAVGGFA